MRRLWRLVAAVAAVLAVGHAQQVGVALADPLAPTTPLGTTFQLGCIMVAMYAVKYTGRAVRR